MYIGHQYDICRYIGTPLPDNLAYFHTNSVVFYVSLKSHFAHFLNQEQKLIYCYVIVTYTHTPQGPRNLETRRPEAVVHERSEGATKGLKIYKFCRLHCGCIYVTVLYCIYDR